MKNNATPGYTLLELIVSMGLFSMIMLVATGAYLSLIAFDREVRLTNELVNNLSFAVDSMSRNIRTGTNYECTPGDTNGNSLSGSCAQLEFTSSEGCQITYKNLNGVIVQSSSGAGCTTGTNLPLTDSRIQLSTSSPYGLVFYVRGVGTGDDSVDHLQPIVIFRLHGTLEEVPGKKTSFTIQGQATQRFIEI